MLKYIVIGALVVAGLGVLGCGGAKAGASSNSGAGALVSYEELSSKLAKKEQFVLLDVRTQEEFASGHIEGAVLLPYDEVEKKAAGLLPDKEKAIIVYCRSGRRSAIAAESLRGLGYKDVRDFGGVNRWQGQLVK
ncbi:MAG: rhodanese-like domain-containing protein [Phascolarctobacterium sp.]|nr:rhodanese-like domain-containing protein [Phascolarctobacterium sp.]